MNHHEEKGGPENPPGHSPQVANPLCGTEAATTPGGGVCLCGQPANPLSEMRQSRLSLPCERGQSPRALSLLDAQSEGSDDCRVVKRTGGRDLSGMDTE